jgi:ribonuclease P protein component
MSNKFQHLKRRANFIKASNGKKIKLSFLTLLVFDRQDKQPTRVGFTITKKNGNAVIRNRIKRRLREILRLSCNLPEGYDLVFVGYRKIVDLDFKYLQEKINESLMQI